MSLKHSKRLAPLCRICEEEINIGEPFTVIFVLGRSGEPVNTMIHYSCTVTTIAGECAEQVLDAMEKGSPAVRLHADGDEDGTIRSKLHSLFADVLDDVLG